MRFLGRLFSVVCVLSVLSACSDKAESLPIVPYPQDVVIETGSFNALGAKVISEGLDDAEIALVDNSVSRLQALQEIRRVCQKLSSVEMTRLRRNHIDWKSETVRQLHIHHHTMVLFTQ